MDEQDFRAEFSVCKFKIYKYWIFYTMPLTDAPPASIWPMDLTSDLQNIENLLDAYIKK